MKKIYTYVIFPMLFYIILMFFIQFIIGQKTSTSVVDWKLNLYVFLLLLIGLFIIYKKRVK